MRGVVGALALLLLAGCGGDAPAAERVTAEPPAVLTSEVPTPEPVQEPEPVPELDPAAAERFLVEVRSGMLLGDYRDSELVDLASAMCRDRRAGLDPFEQAEAPGDGTYGFEQVQVPVFAVDALTVDLAAREHVCRDV